MSESRKQISFDLDTTSLKVYYPKENWQNAYNDIRIFMQKNEFQWQQGSVYISKNRLSIQSISKLLETMVNEYPWLNVCMRDCVVTNIGRSHSQNYLFDKNADIQPREKSFEDDKIMDIVTDVVFAKDTCLETKKPDKDFEEEMDR